MAKVSVDANWRKLFSINMNTDDYKTAWEDLSDLIAEETEAFEEEGEEEDPDAINNYSDFQ